MGVSAARRYFTVLIQGETESHIYALEASICFYVRAF